MQGAEYDIEEAMRQNQRFAGLDSQAPHPTPRADAPPQQSPPDEYYQQFRSAMPAAGYDMAPPLAFDALSGARTRPTSCRAHFWHSHDGRARLDVPCSVRTNRC